MSARKIIITRRIWQLIAAAGLVALAMATKEYPMNPRFGSSVGGSIFTIILGLTLLREERRALHSPDSNRVINWNLAEAIVLFFSTLGGFASAWMWRLPEIDFYAYLHTGLLGLLGGVAAGELLWQNVRLKALDDTCRNRYWAGYKDSIF